MPINDIQKEQIWSLVSKVILKTVMTRGGGLDTVMLDKQRPLRVFETFEDYKEYVFSECDKYVDNQDDSDRYKWIGCWELILGIIPMIQSQKDVGDYIKETTELYKILHSED